MGARKGKPYSKSKTNFSKSFDYAERSRKEAFERLMQPGIFNDDNFYDEYMIGSVTGRRPDTVIFDDIEPVEPDDSPYEKQRKIYDQIRANSKLDASRYTQEYKMAAGQEPDYRYEIKRLQNMVDDQRKDLREKSKLVGEYKELVQEQRAVINELKKELYRKEQE